MPKYCYKCCSCGKEIESRHSMQLDPDSCSQLPDNECEENGEVEKQYNFSFSSKGTRNIGDDQEKETGEVVEEKIEENREELNQRKQELKNRDYKPEK